MSGQWRVVRQEKDEIFALPSCLFPLPLATGNIPDQVLIFIPKTPCFRYLPKVTILRFLLKKRLLPGRIVEVVRRKVGGVTMFAPTVNWIQKSIRSDFPNAGYNLQDRKSVV